MSSNGDKITYIVPSAQGVLGRRLGVGALSTRHRQEDRLHHANEITCFLTSAIINRFSQIYHMSSYIAGNFIRLLSYSYTKFWTSPIT